jgi:DEAD/DEAH box helicase domain-containing protein
MSARQVIEATARCIAETDNLQVLFDPAVQPSRDGDFQPLSESSLCSSIVDYLSGQFSDGLYTHQHDAIESVLTGNNTVVATRTSSGKSLIYSLPAFHTVCDDPDATALFLYPQKALANDQLLKLREMAAAIPCIAKHHAGKDHFISRYDGSTEVGVRPAIREQVQLMLTNPDMLHFSVLQHHERHWQRFFRNLKLVAIDECHEYRGIFGTNVSHVLHRLRQLCQHYGSDPKFIATSATVSDPQEHMQQLTGVPFTCVDSERDGSQQGQRKFWMVTSPSHYHDTGRDVALKLAEAGLSVLAFCPTRVAAEQMMSRLERHADGADHSFVRVYRSGLSAEQREEIECGLRDRSVRLVFSTSALELGIDIGSIDVVVCIGLPHSMMSLWQRAGRSARGGRDGAAVFVPAETPIDSWYAAHPEELFARDHEPLVLNRTNQRLLCQHYACAVQEAGGDDDSMAYEALGDEMRHIHDLRENGQLDRDEFYRAEPHMEVSIRGMGDGSYDLMVGKEKLGEIDSQHLPTRWQSVSCDRRHSRKANCFAAA